MLLIQKEQAVVRKRSSIYYKVYYFITGCKTCVKSSFKSGNAVDLSLYDPGSGITWLTLLHVHMRRK